jgi:hypothetical protein
VPANKRGRPPIHGRRSAQYQQELKRQKLAGLKQEVEDVEDYRPPEQLPLGDECAFVPCTAPTTAITPPASAAYTHAPPIGLRHQPPPPLPASSSPPQPQSQPPPPPPPEQPFFHATNSLLNAFFSNFTSATISRSTPPQASPPPPLQSSPSPLQPTSPLRHAVNPLGVAGDGQCHPVPGGDGSSSDLRVEQLVALTRQLTAEVRQLREANESLHRANAALHERLAEVEARQAAQSRRVQTLYEIQEAAPPPPQLSIGNAMHGRTNMDDAFRPTAWGQARAGTTLVQPARAIEIEDKQTWGNLLLSPLAAAAASLPVSRSSSASSATDTSSAESLPTSPRSSFSLERSVLQSSLMASQQALDEMQHHVPHLRLYYVAPKDFAVQDMRYILCTTAHTRTRTHVTNVLTPIHSPPRYPVYVLAPPAGGDCVSPVVRWVNEAFVSLSGYTRVRRVTSCSLVRACVRATDMSVAFECWLTRARTTQDKLIGMPLPRLFSSQKSQTTMLAAVIFNQYGFIPHAHRQPWSSLLSDHPLLCHAHIHRAPMSASGTFGLHPLLRQRNGCTVRIDELNQFFYGQHGAVRHTGPALSLNVSHGLVSMCRSRRAGGVQRDVHPGLAGRHAAARRAVWTVAPRAAAHQRMIGLLLVILFNNKARRSESALSL